MCVNPSNASLKKDKEAAYGFNHEGEKAVSKEGMAIFDGDRLWQKREYFSLTKSGTLQRREALYGVCEGY